MLRMMLGSFLDVCRIMFGSFLDNFRMKKSWLGDPFAVLFHLGRWAGEA